MTNITEAELTRLQAICDAASGVPEMVWTRNGAVMSHEYRDYVRSATHNLPLLIAEIRRLRKIVIGWDAIAKQGTHE